jgi:protocatechuate 3,4-dioxygenase beta subunit
MTTTIGEIVRGHPNFLGVGRCLTDVHGLYRFLTIRPGA